MPLRRALVCSALIASLLTGCAAVGPNFAPPTPPTTAGYSMSGDSAPGAGIRFGPPAAGPWWKSFGPPALDQMEQAALSGSPTLARADATLKQAQAEFAAALGGLKPGADANAGAQRQRLNLSSFGFGGGGGAFPGFTNNPEFSLYSVGGTVNFPLDVFGGQRRRAENAAALAEAAARRADAAALTLTGQVATAAVQVAGLQAEVAALEQVVREDQENFELARKASSLGGGTSGGSITAYQQLARDEALLPPVRQMLAVARHQLALLVGKGPGDFVLPDFTLADFRAGAAPVALPSELVRLRPDIQQAEADLHAATAAVGIATAALYPSMTLTGTLTQSALTPDKIFRPQSNAYNLGLQLAAPIFDGGRRRAEREAARAAARASLAAYQQTVLVAFNQVADRLEALANDDEALAANAKTLYAAEEYVRLARIAFEAGAIGVQLLIDGERQLAEARRIQVESQTRRALDTVQLIIASGARWRG